MFDFEKYKRLREEKAAKEAEKKRQQKEREKERAKKKRAEQRAKEKTRKQAKLSKEKEKQKVKQKEISRVKRNKRRRERYAEKKEEQLRLRFEEEQQIKRENYSLIRQYQNQKYYTRKKHTLEVERMKLGDENGFFSIYITQDRQRIVWVGSARWKSDAYALYNVALEMNRENTMVPVENRIESGGANSRKTIYELIMVKKTKEGEDSIVQFRDDNGKFIDNIITDSNEHVIVTKDKWFVEETFHVYGYHPRKDRKDANFIYENIIMTNLRADGDPKRIRMFANKLIIETFDNFDLVIAKSREECQRLYHAIQKRSILEKQNQVVFTGNVPNMMKTTILDKIQEKTGWPRSICKVTTSF